MAGCVDGGGAGEGAGILIDALRASAQEDVDRWLMARNPMLTAGDFATFPVGTSVALRGAPADATAKGEARKTLRLPDRLPAVWLPPAADLAVAARSAPLAGLLAGLTEWVGRGQRVESAQWAGRRRPLARGEVLPAAQAAQAARWLGVPPGGLRLLWEYARAASWVELADGGDGGLYAVPGQMAAAWQGDDGASADRGPLGAWTALLTAVLASTLDVAESLSPVGQGTLSFEGQGSLAALKLFLARGEGGLPAERVRDVVVHGVGGDLAGRARKQLDARAGTQADPVRVLIDQLASLRAVEASPAGEGRIRLTPLAQRALRVELVAAGVDVPAVAADPAMMSAADLAALHGGMLPVEFGQVASHWMATRGPRRAAGELLHFAAGADAASRLVAIGVVRGMGDCAAPAWRDALKRPEVRPYARIELSRLASETKDSTMPLVLEPGPDDLTWLATDLLALACGEDDPDPELIAAQFREAVPGEEEWIFGLMSMGSHPDVVRVLTALGRYHPDRRVAREARKAAHRAAAQRSAAQRAAHGAASHGLRA
jgi:hypothetical protein